MQDIVQALLQHLSLERLEENLFRGQSQDIGSPNVYGGQVLGQALSAASRTIEGRDAHSLHAYFLRPGDKTQPVVYEVDRIRDGRSYTTRRVVAIQNGQPIFNMAASFKVAEAGLEHQCVMPEVPGPEGLLNLTELGRQSLAEIPDKLERFLTWQRPIEFRPVRPTDLLHPEPAPPCRDIWIRAVAALPDEPALHKVLLAYTSDYSLLATALLPHGLTFSQGTIRAASLDHAMWFHRDFRLDDWLLYAMDSPNMGHGRGFSRGNLFTREGKLVASVAQEGMIRQH
ncbi:acyl-CoA thioesterase [Geopsychrobacter electrodiphilus]|uniref:acyl-CoA thioesterase n=1 Tax=Geopsychrobacter electrodiphilus TaxID=225196 RepID=UPI00037DF2F4|nr:acyl-CoA thioesterase II [Geopsychrobacter electrodiphilus]